MYITTRRKRLPLEAGYIFPGSFGNATGCLFRNIRGRWGGDGEENKGNGNQRLGPGQLQAPAGVRHGTPAHRLMYSAHHLHVVGEMELSVPKPKIKKIFGMLLQTFSLLTQIVKPWHIIKSSLLHFQSLSVVFWGSSPGRQH